MRRIVVFIDLFVSCQVNNDFFFWDPCSNLMLLSALVPKLEKFKRIYVDSQRCKRIISLCSWEEQDCINQCYWPAYWTHLLGWAIYRAGLIRSRSGKCQWGRYAWLSRSASKWESNKHLHLIWPTNRHFVKQVQHKDFAPASNPTSY